MTIGTLWQLADLPGMPSAPTLRTLIRRHADFPIIEHGAAGRQYQIDLDAAAAFVRSHWGDARLRKAYGSPADASPQGDLPFPVDY